MINYETLFSKNILKMKRSDIRELLKLTQKPDIISFGGGLPAPDMFPVEEIKEMSRIVLERNGKSALQYGLTEGDKRLREELVKMLNKDGIHLEVDNILVTTSSQQGLDLVGKIFLNPGDYVVTSRPTYVGAIQAFQSYGAKMDGVDQDEDGTRVADLDKLIRKLIAAGKKPKFIYEIPDFQNPSGITMILQRREELIKLAEKHDLLIVEDSPYRQLRFEGESQPPLLALNSERVVSLYTFSKILLPGFRLGWMAGPLPIIQKAVTAKQAVDLCSPAFNQMVFSEFISRGLLDIQIEKIKVAYREKRDFMIAKLEQYMPKLEGLHWTRPQGGLFLWMTLPKYMDVVDMLPTAIEHKVAYVIGSAFYPDGSGRNCMRMNFSFSSKADIEEGVKRLGKLISEWKPKKN